MKRIPLREELIIQIKSGYIEITQFHGFEEFNSTISVPLDDAQVLIRALTAVANEPFETVPGQ